MENFHEVFLVEHCAEKREFRIERFDMALRRNLRSFSYGQQSGWDVVAAAKSKESALGIMESLIAQAADFPSN